MKTLHVSKYSDKEAVIMLPEGKLSFSTGGEGPSIQSTFTYWDVLEAILEIQEKGLAREFKSQAAIIAFVKNKFGKESNYNSFLE